MPKEFTSQKRIHSQELKRKQIWEAMFLLDKQPFHISIFLHKPQ